MEVTVGSEWGAGMSQLGVEMRLTGDDEGILRGRGGVGRTYYILRGNDPCSDYSKDSKKSV